MLSRRRGKIICTGSTGSFKGLLGLGHYVAAKHGVIGLVKTLAIELAPYNVNVNAGVIAFFDMHSDKALRRLRRDRPYERLTITGIQGLTQAQLASFRALGAVEKERA